MWIELLLIVFLMYLVVGVFLSYAGLIFLNEKREVVGMDLINLIGTSLTWPIVSYTDFPTQTVLKRNSFKGDDE